MKEKEQGLNVSADGLELFRSLQEENFLRQGYSGEDAKALSGLALRALLRESQPSGSSAPMPNDASTCSEYGKVLIAESSLQTIKVWEEDNKSLTVRIEASAGVLFFQIPAAFAQYVTTLSKSVSASSTQGTMELIRRMKENREAAERLKSSEQ